MLLAVDIGNSNIHSGIFEESFLKKDFKIPTYTDDLGVEYRKKLRPYIRSIDKVILVSVVPKISIDVKRVLRSTLGIRILVVGENIDSGVKNCYNKPKQVGQDRLVNARAGFDLYGGESIIVDFGTAITIDMVNRKKEYLGGLIVPGLELSLNALSGRAALLPKIILSKPRSLLGKETKDSMISGAVYGISSLCDGVVNKLKNKYSKDAKAIATGGVAEFISPYCKSIEKVDRALTLKGLQLISEEKDV
ncbi:MAG: type III pantothenate kinase [Candidatus Omnitrophota bacterium]